MHLLNNYALNSASKIDVPYIHEEFFPICVENYITFQPFSKSAKSYDFWSNLIDILNSFLVKSNIKIIQIGGANEIAINGCIHTQGQTTINQVAYILKNSQLHLGADSFAVHFASSYGKKIVALYSNSYLNNVRPYWSAPEDVVLLEPERKNGEKPSHSLEENPKTINRIKIEDIVNAVLKLLNIPERFEFKTCDIGEFYKHRILELVPNQYVPPSQFGVDSVLVRMDYLFNQEILAKQLSVGKATIITDKEIDLQLLAAYKTNIVEIIYIITKNHKPDFVKNVISLGIKIGMMSFMSDREINECKIDYMDYGIINPRKFKKPEFLEKESKKGLLYSSNKFTLSQGKIYNSKASWQKDISVPNFGTNISPIIDDEEFWKEAEYFWFLKSEKI